MNHKDRKNSVDSELDLFLFAIRTEKNVNLMANEVS